MAAKYLEANSLCFSSGKLSPDYFPASDPLTQIITIIQIEAPYRLSSQLNYEKVNINIGILSDYGKLSIILFSSYR